MASTYIGAKPSCGAGFLPTRWTVVLSASDPQAPHAATALEALCRAYWYPLYAYVRRRGYSPADAEDLTQEFFARLLLHNWVARADPHKGRFRSFLLMAMSRFLANEWDRAHTLKRGVQVRLVPLPLDTAETRYAQEPADTSTPEQAFERRWALATLDDVLEQLSADYEKDGKAALFAALKPCLIGSRETQPYAALASQLGMSEGAVKTAVSRLRERYRQRLREAVAQTVASPAEVDAELRHLVRILVRG
jgi:RNA polymerase sigma-70 factor (ECF subfamily)